MGSMLVFWGVIVCEVKLWGVVMTCLMSSFLCALSGWITLRKTKASENRPKLPQKERIVSQTLFFSGDGSFWECKFKTFYYPGK